MGHLPETQERRGLYDITKVIRKVKRLGTVYLTRISERMVSHVEIVGRSTQPVPCHSIYNGRVLSLIAPDVFPRDKRISSNVVPRILLFRS